MQPAYKYIPGDANSNVEDILYIITEYLMFLFCQVKSLNGEWVMWDDPKCILIFVPISYCLDPEWHI